MSINFKKFYSGTPIFVKGVFGHTYERHIYTSDREVVRRISQLKFQNKLPQVSGASMFIGDINWDVLMENIFLYRSNAIRDWLEQEDYLQIVVDVKIRPVDAEIMGLPPVWGRVYLFDSFHDWSEGALNPNGIRLVLQRHSIWERSDFRILTMFPVFLDRWNM